MNLKFEIFLAFKSTFIKFVNSFKFSKGIFKIKKLYEFLSLAQIILLLFFKWTMKIGAKFYFITFLLLISEEFDFYHSQKYYFVLLGGKG